MIYVRARLLPRAWELSILELCKRGRIIMTEYGERSVDSPAVILVEEPLAEPRIHLKGCIGGIKLLSEYVEEVLNGANDWRVGRDWHYTYHERLFRYRQADDVIDQIDYIVCKLFEVPYSRRAIAITWQPWKDIKVSSPPCIIYLWCRIIGGKLCMHTHMRSNDALKAAFMNMYALIELQRMLANRLGSPVGYYMHIADSYHVYERDWKWFKKFAEQVESGRSKKYWMYTQESL